MDLGRVLVFSTVYYRCLKNEKLWDSIPYHMKDSNEFKHVIKTSKPDLCAHAGFAKFVYKILDICSQLKKIHLCI